MVNRVQPPLVVAYTACVPAFNGTSALNEEVQ